MTITEDVQLISKLTTHPLNKPKIHLISTKEKEKSKKRNNQGTSIFDNLIVGGRGFEPWIYPLKTLGGANQFSYKHLGRRHLI